jgi:hypothetical protein
LLFLATERFSDAWDERDDRGLKASRAIPVRDWVVTQNRILRHASMGTPPRFTAQLEQSDFVFALNCFRDQSTVIE